MAGFVNDEPDFIRRVVVTGTSLKTKTCTVYAGRTAAEACPENRNNGFLSSSIGNQIRAGWRPGQVVRQGLFGQAVAPQRRSPYITIIKTVEWLVQRQPT